MKRKIVNYVSNYAKRINSLWRQYLERFVCGTDSNHCDLNV